MKIIILGAGSFAREVTDIAHDLGHEVACYVVDSGGRHECSPIVHLLEGPQHVHPTMPPCAVGFISPKRVRLLEDMKVRGFQFVSLVHPSASVSRLADVLPGAVVGRLVAVGSGAAISTGAIVNRGATVGHDCTIGRCATIGPGANLAGGVTVEAGATVGMGACIREGLTIGEGAFVGMGSVVLKNVPAGELWAGNPADWRAR